MADGMNGTNRNVRFMDFRCKNGCSITNEVLMVYFPMFFDHLKKSVAQMHTMYMYILVFVYIHVFTYIHIILDDMIYDIINR